MTLEALLPLLVVAAIAGYVGYLLGRASVLTANAGNDPARAPSPLPSPEFETAGTGAASQTPQRRSAPPPASAGGGPAPSSGAGSSGHAVPPRRSSKPPPAAAGLLDRDGK